MNFTALSARNRAKLSAAFIAAISFTVIFSDQHSSRAQRMQRAGKEKGADVVLAGTISGRVFQDFNGNGAYDTANGLNSVDTGVQGVTVSAYDSLGVLRGSAVSDASGTYSLAASGTGPYRVEFSAIPAGFSQSARSTDSVAGGTASDAGSSVQFVADSNTPNVNLALERAEEFCQNNPDLVLSRFAMGAQNGTYASNVVLINFPYGSGTSYTDTTVANYDNPTTHSMTTTASAVGTIFSLAYARSTKRLYAASYFKRHAGFGPGADGIINNADDPAAIYVVNTTTNAMAAKFSVPGVTVNAHDTTDYNSDNEDTGRDAAGKTSLGGMAISADDSRLFVMNLQNRRLYALDPSTGASLGNSLQATSLTLPTPGGTAANCASNDIRPFAVEYYRSQLYIGIVCSAESTGSANNLFAYIVQADPSTLAFGPVVYSSALNYPRGFADPGWSARWQPWRPTFTSDFAAPQPMLASIKFESGNVILGLRDRAGDQELDNGPDAKRTAGDVLKACGSLAAWTLESNGRCGSAPAFGQAPQATGQGPGNGEFYHQDDFCLTPNGANYHDEVAWGALMYIPGRPHVLTTLLDPISRTISSGATFDGGLRWMNNSTGASDRAYRVYNGTGGVGVPDFGKANGLGGVTSMCGAAPIEIGNRVFRDLNSNGVQDANELGIPGVTVRLYSGSTAVGTAVTDASGEYYFTSSSVADPNTSDNIGQVNGGIQYSANYQVRFDNPANYSGGGPLSGLLLTVLNATGQSGDDDATDSDAANVTNPAGSPAGTFPVISITTGGQGANDHTFDVGFRSVPLAADMSLSGRVVTADDRGIANAKVTLYQPDGSAITTVTGRRGSYTFNGLEGGHTVIVSVAARRFVFSDPLRVVQLNDNVTGLDFVADE